MSIKIQQIEVQGNNTKYSVNYNNQQNRTFIVPNDKKDEFVSKYPKAHAINQAITSGSLILVCGFSAIGGSKLVSKISKVPSKLAKFGAGVAAACAFGFAYLTGAALVLNKFDKKLLDKYNAKEITESKNNG